MLMFSFLAVPIFSFFSFRLHAMGKKKVTLQISPFFKGILWFVISLIALIIFYNPTPASFSWISLFLFYFLNEHLLFIVAGLAGYFLFHGFYYNYKKDDKFVQSLFFLTGFYIGVSIQYFIRYYPDLDIYILFILPLLHCTTVLLVSLFIDKIFNAYGRDKILYWAMILLVPVVLSLLSMLFAYNFIFLSFILSFLLAGGSFFIYYVVRDM